MLAQKNPWFILKNMPLCFARNERNCKQTALMLRKGDLNLPVMLSSQLLTSESMRGMKGNISLVSFPGVIPHHNVI